MIRLQSFYSQTKTNKQTTKKSKKIKTNKQKTKTKTTTTTKKKTYYGSCLSSPSCVRVISFGNEEAVSLILGPVSGHSR